MKLYNCVYKLLNYASNERLFNTKCVLYDSKGGRIWRVDFSVFVEWF